MIYSPEMLRAKNILVALFAVFLVSDLALIVAVGDPMELIRMVLTIGLMYFVVIGKPWAKWTMIVLGGVAAIIGIVFGALLLLRGVPIGAMALFGMALWVSVVPTYLLLSKNLKEYLLARNKASSIHSVKADTSGGSRP